MYCNVSDLDQASRSMPGSPEFYREYNEEGNGTCQVPLGRTLSCNSIYTDMYTTALWLFNIYPLPLPPGRTICLFFTWLFNMAMPLRQTICYTQYCTKILDFVQTKKQNFQNSQLGNSISSMLLSEIALGSTLHKCLLFRTYNHYFVTTSGF